MNWLNQNGVTGIEVANSDTTAFAEAIDRLLLNEDNIRVKLGENAHNRIVENFTMARIKTIIDKEYKALI